MENLKAIVLVACALIVVVVPSAEASPEGGGDPDVGPVGDICIDIHPDTPMDPVEVYHC